MNWRKIDHNTKNTLMNMRRKYCMTVYIYSKAMLT